jgi:DUF1009 family protein
VYCADSGGAGRERVAILSGAGPFPVMIARRAAARGVEVLALGWEGKVDKELKDAAQMLYLYPFGLLEGMMKVLSEENIKEAMLAGKFDKNWIYQGGVRIDDIGRKFLNKVRDHQDDTMLDFVERILKERGIEVVENTKYIKEWLAPAGVLTGRTPNQDEKKDIEFGMKVLKDLGRLGIGQSVVVKQGNVVAVEAMEHTDETILRGGKLAGDGAVVVKAARPDQDMRWDVPVVGMETIRTLKEAGAAVLAVEANKVVLIEKEKLITLANKYGICITGIQTK